MNDREEALLLLNAAERDLRALRAMNDPLTFAEEIFGFHAQQASEKSLKAWLCARGCLYRLTHDLSLLIADLNQANQDAAPFADLDRLNAYAVQFRYGGVSSGTAPLDRSKFVELIAALIRQVHANLPAE